MNKLESLESSIQKRKLQGCSKDACSVDDSKGWKGHTVHCKDITPLHKLGEKMDESLR